MPAIYSKEKSSIRIPVTFKPRESKIFIFEKYDAGNQCLSPSGVG